MKTGSIKKPSFDQRKALEQSEKRASESQPRNFDERNLTEKVVEIPPKGKTKTPIKGLDPKRG